MSTIKKMLTNGTNESRLKTPGRSEGIVVKSPLVVHILEKNTPVPNISVESV
jgi:hypothetical protein